MDLFYIVFGVGYTSLLGYLVYYHLLKEQNPDLDHWLDNFIKHVPVPYPLNIFFEDDEDKTKEPKKRDKPEPAAKYEDKYLTKLRNTSDELIFTEEEKAILDNKREQFTEENAHFEAMWQKKVDQIQQILDQRRQQALLHYEDPDLALLVKETESDWAALQNAKPKTPQEIEEDAIQYIIQQRVEHLKNNIVIEKTPLGNVLLFYNHQKESFSFYSDFTIPYRFLEVVARRYVLTFQCKNLYVDMEQELKDAEKKWQDKKAWEKEQKEKQANEPAATTHKNLFAKFKNYNKDNKQKTANTNSRTNTNPLSRYAQTLPNSTTNPTKEDEIILLKERANRYTYEGKFANYSFLQKVDKKVIDKNMAMSFSEYKSLFSKST
jgi:septum formation inhibitor MinC